MAGKPPRYEQTLKILKKAGSRGMFVSELARAAKITPTSVNRYLTSRFKRLVKIERRGGLKFVYWVGKND